MSKKNRIFLVTSVPNGICSIEGNKGYESNIYMHSFLLYDDALKYALKNNQRSYIQTFEEIECTEVNNE